MRIRIGTLLSVALIVVAVGLIGCPKAETTDGPGATTQPAGPVTAVNAKCPMTGGTINSAKMSAGSVSDFDGKKVGFCCPSCIPKWEKLSDEEKKTKLAAAMP